MELEAPVELVAVSVDEGVETRGYRVKCVTRNGETEKEETIMCKYLIGADGGRSFVRRALDVPFDGSTTEDKWVTVDGVIEMDMPKPRTYCAIESPTHGNVLWAALDHGVTRIGFAFTAERQKAYPEFNKEAAVKEAIASVKPFKLRFKQVDWFTVYSVGQRVARNFFVKECVFLAGDACHTHSSGAAQGMNTGIHDASNLGWKLSMVLKGQTPPSLLETYASERLPNVQKLIDYDKDISRLMTMQLPIGWKGDLTADPNEILGVVMEEASTFTSGLSIAFDSNNVNIKGSFESSSDPALVGPGQRGPDVQLQKPGTTRLHAQTPKKERFHIIVFVREPEHTSADLKAFSDAVEISTTFQNPKSPISWLKIPAKSSPSACELLAIMPLGKVSYDEKQTAHERYGIDVRKGGVVVLRPDGWTGTMTVLNTGAVAELETYFKGVLLIE